MNPLPPLRTVRPAAPSAPPAPDAPTPFPAALPPPGDLPAGLPVPAQALFRELLALQLLDPEALREFVAKAAAKLPGLTTRERAGSALVRAGLLTAYQRDRVLSGNTFGLTLGPYRVLDRLGGGAVGLAFLAEHGVLRRRVAVKVVPADGAMPPEVVERFRAEARVLAALDHPHVVTAHDAGCVPAPTAAQPVLHYLVLELVPGGDLEQFVCAHGRQPVPRACEWARQAAAGLQAAHDRQLVHRDVKPDNLLLTADGRVKVIDFGLARRFASALTPAGALVGTVEFMAPEQAVEPAAVGPAADVYGLGATLFWVLTGELPVPRGETLAETVRALAAARPRRLRDFLPDAPAELDRLVARMLARNPADRPTAGGAADALAAFAADGDPASEVERLREAVRRQDATLRAKDAAVRQARDAALAALAVSTGTAAGHRRRVGEYVRVLLDRLKGHPGWVALAGGEPAADLIRCAPLYALDTAGGERLDALAAAHGDALPFLGVLRGVARSHGERWDGTGKPDGLQGVAIPPAARLATVAKVYEELRAAHAGRPEMAHAQAALTILGTAGRFDPAVLAAFQAAAAAFDEVYQTVAD